MASYYYLIASLPDLRADGDMPITYDEFLDMCESWVSGKKYEFLKDLTLSSSEGPVVEEWSRIYGDLMKELNSLRSAALGKQYNADFNKDFENSQAAAGAMAAKNPLEAEKILLEREFNVLDALVGMHSFDDTFLFGYAIKLRLLERQSCFETQKGKDEFKHLFDEVQQRVYSL